MIGLEKVIEHLYSKLSSDNSTVQFINREYLWKLYNRIGALFGLARQNDYSGLTSKL